MEKGKAEKKIQEYISKNGISQTFVADLLGLLTFVVCFLIYSFKNRPFFYLRGGDNPAYAANS